MCLEPLELELPASVPAVPTRSAAVARISRWWASVARSAARRRGCRQEDGAKTRHKQPGSEKAQARWLISPVAGARDTDSAVCRPASELADCPSQVAGRRLLAAFNSVLHPLFQGLLR